MRWRTIMCGGSILSCCPGTHTGMGEFWKNISFFFINFSFFCCIHESRQYFLLFLGQPVYRLAFIRRECASDPVTSQCLSTDVPDVNLQYVSCQETCQSNGCNIGWRKWNLLMKFQFNFVYARYLRRYTNDGWVPRVLLSFKLCTPS